MVRRLRLVRFRADFFLFIFNYSWGNVALLRSRGRGTSEGDHSKHA